MQSEWSNRKKMEYSGTVCIQQKEQAEWTDNNNCINFDQLENQQKPIREKDITVHNNLQC